ncbi:MAG: ATP-dependent Clp protease ATP-binding subunit [Deltaproteobacteria bacterium]|nr:ATP-dependent Clp protease ATP-binding subunit [Deltaproteobacteria bacterium]
MGARATFRTAIVIEALPRGRWLAWPLAEPSFAQLGGPDEDPRLVMSLALPEHLGTRRGSELATWATPAGTTLGTTAVTLERLEQPARLQRAFTIAVPWVTTPYGRDLWLHVLPLGLTLRVDEGSYINDVVASEVRRVIAATEPSPDALLAMFPALGHRLDWIDVELGGDPRATSGATAKTIAAHEAHALLVTVASPMHADRRLLDGAPLVARPRELDALDRLLARHSVLVHGPELAGKTALVEGWLRARLATPEPRAADALPPVLVYATSGARLMAGMSLLGQWQERLRRVLDAVATLSAVLWIEHLGELVGDGGQGDELANALRPWLEDGRVRLVTELRDDEIDRLERRQPALLALLRRVHVAPLSTADALRVLDARRLHLDEREPGRPGFGPSALPELVALATRYQTQLALPGAAVRLGEDLRNLADAEPSGGRRALIDAHGVQRLYAALTGLPAWLLDDRRPYDVEATRAALGAQVIGQPAAVGAVAESLALVKTRLAARGKPLGSFLFAGPTGVGKTELARALAIHLFGSERRLVRFDMSEFMDAAAAERLIRGGAGDADGPRDGLLTRRLRREPLSVVLLDEIEKAHKSVFDLLLQALGDGRLTDASGRTASLEGAIVILTTNLGASDRSRRIGLLAEGAESLAAHYLGAVKRHFAPELVNRLERIIPFEHLGPEPLRKIVRLQVERVRRRRGLGRIELAVSDAALDLIAARGTTAEYGARALRRAVDRLLTTPLAHVIAARPSASIGRVEVDVAGDALAFGVVERARLPGDNPLSKVARMRREARALMRSMAVREIHDRLEHLEADLLRGAPAGPILAERARLEALVAPVKEVVGEVEALEDLLHLAVGKDGPLAPEEVAAELARLDARVEELDTAAFEILTATESRRDLAVVAVTELDDERGFDKWLVPLLEAAEARRWRVTAWIEGEHGPGAVPESGRWPRGLALGPPRTADELYVRIAERPSDFRHVVLGVHGRHAGTLLACEAGLIALRPGGAPPSSLFVKVLSLLRSTLTPEAVADSELLGPPPMEQRGPMASGRATRVFTTRPDRVTLMVADGQLGFMADVPGYFAAWERYAGRHIRAVDEHATRDRSELFDSPLDDELAMKKLAREMDAAFAEGLLR